MREELVALSPDNSGYKRDLFVSNAKLGLFAIQQRNLPDAIEYYDKMVGMMEKLVKMAPSNHQWKRDLQKAQRDLERLKQKAKPNPDE